MFLLVRGGVICFVSLPNYMPISCPTKFGNGGVTVYSANPMSKGIQIIVACGNIATRCIGILCWTVFWMKYDYKSSRWDRRCRAELSAGLSFQQG